MRIYETIRPAVFALDAERAHDLTLRGLAQASRSERLLHRVAARDRVADTRLATYFFGRTIATPLGVAAGLDKNGVAIPALLALGFGFIEVGTVTLKPQPGNEKPRIFRLTEDDALINRMGFPSAGAEDVRANLDRFRDVLAFVGVNIGPNKASVEGGTAAADCVELARLFSPLAAYIVINVSSPNTANLRDLQSKAALSELLKQVKAVLIESRRTPLFVKIAPDLTNAELAEIVEVVVETGVSGIVATNTTVARPGNLRSAIRGEEGGLSGRPLRNRALEVVSRIAAEGSDRFSIIATGGIATGADAIAVIAAGAHLVQTYTGFVLRGPGMPGAVAREMSALLDEWRVHSLAEIRGNREFLVRAKIAQAKC